MKITVSAATAKAGNSIHPHAKPGGALFTVAVSLFTNPPMDAQTGFCSNAGWKQRQARKGGLSV
jgi:hypothetical protein